MTYDGTPNGCFISKKDSCAWAAVTHGGDLEEASGSDFGFDLTYLDCCS